MSYQIIDTPEGIAHMRRFTLLQALKMEMTGLKRRGRSAYAIIKQEYGLKGSKQKVYDQFKESVEIISKLKRR